MHETGGLGRFMVKCVRGRGRWALLLAVMMMFTALSAAAAGFDSLETAWALRGAAGEAAISLAAWPDLSPETLNVAQGWLKDLRLTLYAKGNASALALHDGPRQVILAETPAEEEGSRLILSASGSLAPTEYLGSADAPPLQTLFGVPPFPDLRPLAAILPRWAEALADGLKPYEAAEPSKTSVKNVGKADSRLSYVLSAEEANAWWQQTLPRLQPLWAEGTAGLPKAWRDDGAVVLSSLRFTGRLTVRQLLDTAGMGLGFQVTSTLEVLGQARKLDFIAGYREAAGLYLSLKLPATRGKDRLEALISLAFSEKEGARPIRGEFSFTQVREGDKHSLSGKVNLSLTPEGTGERLSGDITCQASQTNTAAPKRGYRLLPDLLAREGSLVGSLKWVESEGNKLLRDANLALDLSPRDAPAPSAPQARVDLRQTDPAALAHARRQAGQALLPYLREKLLTLPLETRLLVLHDWGRVRRALAESSADPLPDIQTDGFTVAEDTDTQPATKEDLP